MLSKAILTVLVGTGEPVLLVHGNGANISPPAYVLGWSDGGIEGLLLGIRHPERVKEDCGQG